MPRDHLVIADAGLAQGFLLHCVARGGAGAGGVARAVVFERVDHAAVLVHQRDIDAFGIDREEGVFVGAGEELAAWGTSLRPCRPAPASMNRKPQSIVSLQLLADYGKLVPKPTLTVVRGRATMFWKSNLVLTAFAVVSLGNPTALRAQSILPDVIGQALGRATSSNMPADCLSLKDSHSRKHIERFDRGAEIGMQAYLNLAASGSNPNRAFKRNWKDSWQLDGVVTEDRADVRDPWASRIARLERIATEHGRSSNYGRAVWNAYDAEGALLGTYDAEMVHRSGDAYAMMRLRLYSPGNIGDVRPVTPYCATPGDSTAYFTARMLRMEKRLNEALEDLVKSEARLAEKPGSRREFRRVERDQKRVAERRTDYDEAAEAFNSAIAREEEARSRLIALGS